MKATAIETSTGNLVTVEAPNGRLPAGYRAPMDHDRACSRGDALRAEIRALDARGDAALAEQARRTLRDARATGIAS